MLRTSLEEERLSQVEDVVVKEAPKPQLKKSKIRCNLNPKCANVVNVEGSG